MNRFIHINRDPDLLPVKVRAYIGGTVILVSLVALLLKSDVWHKLSACGLIIGIFGSGALYWQTIADNRALQSVSNEISRISSRSLSSSEIINVIELSYYGIIFFFVFLILILSHFKTGQNSGLRTMQGLGVSLFISVCPVFFFYLFMKILRFWCSKWFREFQAASEAVRAMQTKRLLRTIGFASLFLSGVMQLLATLF